jgi:uncharacterized protein VirK/YbjX
VNFINDTAWLWATSALVYDKKKGLVVATRRLKFVARALAAYGAVKKMIDPPRESSLGRLMAQRAEAAGAVIWPYQCLAWDPRTRLVRICEHYSEVDRMGGPIDFPVDGKLHLLDLTEIREGLHVSIDQPRWFMREGQLAINLFLDETRLYSLVFSLCRDGEDVAAFIGAVQGRDLDGIMNEYRSLTKAAHGMRPRDLLIEVFRLFCGTAGIARIFAVADEHRQHRSRYYGKASKKKLNVNYDEIWQDRGGKRVDPTFYQLNVNTSERHLERVPAKKRNMYRRRYEMLRTLKQQMRVNWQALKESGDAG